jgi:hypothetical protein
VATYRRSDLDTQHEAQYITPRAQEVVIEEALRCLEKWRERELAFLLYLMY